MFLPRRIGRAAPRPGASKLVSASAAPAAAAPLDPIVPCAGLVIRAWAPGAENEESSSSARTKLVSALESLAPRTVAYVDVEAEQGAATKDGQRGSWVHIRSRTSKHAKNLLRALQPDATARDIPHALTTATAPTAMAEPTPVPVQDAALLSGPSEATYWSKLPERVRNAAAKRVTLEYEQREQARREKRRRKVERRRARRRAVRTAEQ